MTLRGKDHLPNWLLPLLLALAAFVGSRLDVAQELERRLLDARFKARGSRPVTRTPFQIVTIDDQTFDVLDTKFPFRGSIYAKLIENLNRAGARLIVFDLQLTEPHPLFPQDDSLLAATIRSAGNVILSGKISYQYGTGLGAPYATIMPPTHILREAGAPWGITNELTDPDDFSRRYLLYLQPGGQAYASLGMEVLRALLGLPESAPVIVDGKTCRFGNLEIPLYDRQSFLINYYGAPGTFPPISLSSALDDAHFYLAAGNDSDYMENFYSGRSINGRSSIPNPFAGKVILVGASAEELHDTKNTPFYDAATTPRKMPGVEVHAHALQTILDRSFIRRSPPLLALLTALALSLLVFRLVELLRPFKGLLAGALLTAGAVIGSFLLFSRWNYWLDLTVLLLAAALSYLGTALYHYFREKRARANVQEMFAHYVPDQVVKELIQRPELLRLGGERCVVTVLFADLNGFTSISEKMQPEELVAHVNEYLTEMTDRILDYGGIIDKYEGDLIMAEFGAPVPRADHAESACRAALHMQAHLRLLRRRWAEAGKPALTARIGINTGEVIVGNMGSRRVFDYTVIGNAVNLCARLEEANKVYGTEIIISQATRQDLPPGFVIRELDDLRVRGRREAVRVFQLLAADVHELSEGVLGAVELYRQGRSYYLAQDWTRACRAFDAALALCPEDQPSWRLRERCRRFEQQPPQIGWDGVFVSPES